MEGRFEFDGSEVRQLLAESQQASERLMTEAQRYVASGIDFNAGEPGGELPEPDHPGTGAPPGLWLMNDRGVYLRSNARGDSEGWLAHADGYRSEVLVGDEPICEFIDGAALEAVQDDDVLVITLAGDKIRLSILRD